MQSPTRVFVQQLLRSVWTYLAAASTVLTVILLPRQWYWAVGIGLVLLLVIGSIRTVQVIRQESADEIRRLQQENARLRARPYEEAHRRVVEGKLEQLETVHKDLLRFLLHHQPVDRKKLRIASTLGENEFGHCLTQVSQADLTEFYPDSTYRIQYWQVKEQFREVLQDLLFPREEPDEQTHFSP